MLLDALITTMEKEGAKFNPRYLFCSIDDAMVSENFVDFKSRAIFVAKIEEFSSFVYS